MTEQTTTVTLTDIVSEAIGTKEEYTAYSIAVAINKVFKMTDTEKEIPTQMMYQYTRNGMIVKGKKGSAKDIRYTRDEAAAFIEKYTSKHVN